MACLKLPLPPPLPPLGPIGLPSFQLPPLSLNAQLCCRFNLQAYVTLPPLPPIPIVGAVLAVINAEIAALDALIDALDLISLSCPLDDSPITLAA